MTILAAAIPITQPHPLSMLPFAVLLLCIAFLPFVLKLHWERHYHRVALFLASITTAYYFFWIRQPERILREGGDYICFMALVGSLFVVAGGIHVKIRGEATPFFNCALLFFGTIAGNVLGTAGASMLFIRPWIRANKYRYAGLHTAFFIFLISNLGGGLTPMGPPLFLGYIKGVPFWWMIQHCWLGWAVALLALLLIFYLVDRHNFRRPQDRSGKKKPPRARSTSRGCATFSFSPSFSARFSSSTRSSCAKRLCSRPPSDRIMRHRKVCIWPMNFRSPQSRRSAGSSLAYFSRWSPCSITCSCTPAIWPLIRPQNFSGSPAACPPCSTMHRPT